MPSRSTGSTASATRAGRRTAGRPKRTRTRTATAPGRIVVVHNGIIENYLELKNELQAQGHKFKTETDTEIVAHLVEREMQTDGLENAVRRALKLMRGMFAIVLVSVDDPEKIVAVRNGPPIVVGLGEDEFFVASDIPAILSAHARRGVPRRRGDGRHHALRRDVHRLRRPRRVEDDAAGAVGSDRGGKGRPQALHAQGNLRAADRRARHDSRPRLARPGPDLPRGPEHLRRDAVAPLQKVTIIACGTSWHAGLVGKYLIEALAQVPVEVDYGSEYRYRNPIVADRELAIVITQSGETADTLAALREARRKGASSIAICNVVGSMATREADGTVYTHAGPEIGVASTKAFTSQLVALQLLALYMAQVRGTPDAGRRSAATSRSCCRCRRFIEQAIKASAAMEKVAERFYNRTDFLFLGRGINYPIALEGALKLKEISYIHAEGYPAGEMKHGPIALIDERMPVVAIAPDDHVFEKMIGNVQEAKARGGSVIAITTEGDARMAAVLDAGRRHAADAATTPLLTPIVMTIPLQLLAYHIAVRRGCDVDQPRNLAKSVTVE